MVKVVFERIVIPLSFYETAKVLSSPDHYKAKNKRFQILHLSVQKLVAMVDWKFDIGNKLYEV
jgi:hypothetical protein